jgi:hypothetical protein
MPTQTFDHHCQVGNHGLQPYNTLINMYLKMSSLHELSQNGS